MLRTAVPAHVRMANKEKGLTYPTVLCQARLTSRTYLGTGCPSAELLVAVAAALVTAGRERASVMVPSAGRTLEAPTTSLLAGTAERGRPVDVSRLSVSLLAPAADAGLADDGLAMIGRALAPASGAAVVASAAGDANRPLPTEQDRRSMLLRVSPGMRSFRVLIDLGTGLDCSCVVDVALPPAVPAACKLPLAVLFRTTGGEACCFAGACTSCPWRRRRPDTLCLRCESLSRSTRTSSLVSFAGGGLGLKADPPTRAMVNVFGVERSSRFDSAAGVDNIDDDAASFARTLFLSGVFCGTQRAGLGIADLTAEPGWLVTLLGFGDSNGGTGIFRLEVAAMGGVSLTIFCPAATLSSCNG